MKYALVILVFVLYLVALFEYGVTQTFFGTIAFFERCTQRIEGFVFGMALLLLFTVLVTAMGNAIIKWLETPPRRK
jgi:hypothetical protein